VEGKGSEREGGENGEKGLAQFCFPKKPRFEVGGGGKSV